MPRKRKPRLVRSARAIMSSRKEARDSRDFFPTPPFATRALVEIAIPHAGVALDSWWEPACGEGHMSGVLEEYAPGFISDVHDYGGNPVRDFLQTKHVPHECGWIITNPPFRGTSDRAVAFTQHAIGLGRNVAMFVRAQWVVEGTRRYAALFKPHPPTLIAFFSERVPVHKGRWNPKGSTATAYCWVIWIKGREPMPPFWIPPGQRQRLSRPDDVKRFAAWSLPQKEAAE